MWRRGEAAKPPRLHVVHRPMSMAESAERPTDWCSHYYSGNDPEWSQWSRSRGAADGGRDGGGNPQGESPSAVPGPQQVVDGPPGPEGSAADAEPAAGLEAEEYMQSRLEAEIVDINARFAAADSVAAFGLVSTSLVREYCNRDGRKVQMDHILRMMERGFVERVPQGDSQGSGGGGSSR